MSHQRKPAEAHEQPPWIPIESVNRGYLDHFQAYIAKRDGIENFLSISMYASKFILSSSLLHQQHPYRPRIDSFRSSVSLAKQALHLGKFIEDLNFLRRLNFSNEDKSVTTLKFMAHGGSGLYLFVDQLIWLEKSGLVGNGSTSNLDKLSEYAELIGYVGSLGLKSMDLVEMFEKEKHLELIIHNAGMSRNEIVAELNELKMNKLMKQIEVGRSFLDVVMKLAVIRGEKRFLGNPLLVALKGLVWSILNTRKLWNSC